MSVIREAIVLPLAFLTVVLVGGLRPGSAPLFVVPGVFSLVLGILLFGSLVRSGAVVPDALVGAGRSGLAKANGVVLMVCCWAAGAQVVALLTPTSGLPLFFVSVFLFVLLLNTWVSLPDRTHLLRSLMVTFGAAFVLKFVVLSALADPAGGRTRRVLVALFDAATFGGVSQEPQPAAAGYVAFAAIVLFLTGVALLPRARSTAIVTSNYSNSA